MRFSQPFVSIRYHAKYPLRCCLLLCTVFVPNMIHSHLPPIESILPNLHHLRLIIGASAR
ncbi:hypothetical protein BDV98DRAFT_570826 [Pterulicium gracile]|uniref:Uncharacterized protein n=1 Tax=Pterulicium gracile TaxID=1884261 RepID=A0A5C3QF69_9AGAR|nr:hypothetical protein BDV98DRAFT_570826 [Pterula gracilis]